MTVRGDSWTAEQKKEYDQLHKKSKYFRVALDMDRRDMDVIRKAAEQDGKPLAGWIRGLVYKRCEELGLEFDYRYRLSHEEILEQIHKDS